MKLGPNYPYLDRLGREPDIRLNNYKLKLHTQVKYLGIFIGEVLL